MIKNGTQSRLECAVNVLVQIWETDATTDEQQALDQILDSIHRFAVEHPRADGDEILSLIEN